VAEPDPTPPPASESAEWEAERAAQRRRLLLISIAVGGAALVVLIGLLIARPWEAGTPAATSTPTDGQTSVSPDPDPSETPATPEPTDTASPEPVPIESPGVIVSGVTAEVTGIEAVDGVAKGPGEVSGPAIRFTVTITNTTSSTVDLTATVVTVDYGADRTPAGQLYQPGASPMPTKVAAGDTASGVYVFTIPTDQRDLVHITVDYSVGVPPLVFTGKVP